MYETALRLLKEINKFGFKAYIVGGYPRDLYMHRNSTDVDICTNARPKDLKKIFKKTALSQPEYGSITVISNGIRFEITTFRKEIKYKDNRFPIKIKYINSLINDIKRRDFTINTLCIDSDGKTIDLINAIEDIDNKIIRCVGEASVKIEEDILRTLRAIRFATVLNFEIEESLKKAIKKNGHLLKKLSYHRKKEELEKIFSNPNCLYGLQLIKELEIDKHLDLNNFDNVKVTSTSLGIWAQLDVLSAYSFSKNEKDTILQIKEAMKEDAMSNKTLYNYGLYICTIVGEIKQIDRTLIVAKYNNLPIFTKKDIDIKYNEVCELLNKEPGLYLKNIFYDLEDKILEGDLENKKEILISYIMSNYSQI